MMDKISNKLERDDNTKEKLATSKDDMMECRCCLDGVPEDACIDVFCTWNPPWPGMGLSMAEDLAKFAGIQISVSDPHSKIICKKCCIKLQNAINFMLSVQNSDILLRKRLKRRLIEESSWPKPIQIDKNISKDVLQDMEVEIENIKQEVLWEDESDNNVPYIETTDARLETLDIKIEPEEMIQQHSNSIIVPLEENQTSIPNGDAETHAQSGELPQEVKEEPLSEDEMDGTPDIEKDCMLCTKAFPTVRGLKAHVIAVHSYDSVMTPPKPPIDRTNECPICNKFFETRTDLLVHQTCHSKFTCYVCDKKFVSFQQLSRHRTKNCKKRSVMPRLKTLDDVRRLPPPTDVKKFKTSPLRNVCNIDNVQGSVPEVSLDIINLPENIKTQHVINLITVNSKIGQADTTRNTDKSNKEAKINTNRLELISDAKMEDNPEVPCPLEHLLSGKDSEISNKDISIENNELDENSSVRQLETGINWHVVEMEKDICPNDENDCKDNALAVANTSEIEKDIDLNNEINRKDDELTNNNTSKIETDIDICINDKINCKDNEITNDNASEVTSINICSKERSGFNTLEEGNVDYVQLLAALTPETSSNDILESKINITEKDTLTNKSDGKTTILEQMATNETTEQNEITLLHSKIKSECTGDSLETPLEAHSLDKEQNDMETDIEMKSLEQD